MIIKSNTHQFWPGLFRRMIRYADSDKDRSAADVFSIRHNLESFDLDGIIAEFDHNNHFRKERKNGIALRHHIMSFAPESTPYLDQAKLHDLAQKYLELREEKGLVFVKPHLAESHIHLHFIISGNELNSQKSTRRSKRDFLEIHQTLEQYQQAHYPELSDSLVKIIPPRSHLQQLSRLQELVTQAFGQARHQLDFLQRLESRALRPYYHKEQLRGILDTNGQKHRFRKFGIDLKQLPAADQSPLETQNHVPAQTTTKDNTQQRTQELSQLSNDAPDSIELRQ